MIWIVVLPVGIILIAFVVVVGALHLILNWTGFGLHWLCANLTAPILNAVVKWRDKWRDGAP